MAGFSMASRLLTMTIVLCAGLCLSTATWGNHRAEVLRRVAASTVVVLADFPKDVMGQGSGTVIDSQAGYAFILTCAHVVYGATDIQVFPTGRPEEATRAFVERMDKNRDLALLTVKLVLPTLAIAAVGPCLYDTSYLIGAPLGECGLASEAIITDLNYSAYGYLWYRVTNGFTASGISGGTVVNEDGELIGVPTRANSKYPQMGLVIPLSDIREFLK